MIPEISRNSEAGRRSEADSTRNTTGNFSERLTYRFNDLPLVLGVSRRTLERERSAGRFPKPDLMIGKMPLWLAVTIVAWAERGGR